MIIGNKPIGTYVYVLKKLLDKYDQIDLTAGFGNGNSKVIWIANRMVHWGYCTISKIKTNVPSQLEVQVKRSPDFQKLLDAYEVVRAEKAEAYKVKKAAEAEIKAQKEAEKTVVDQGEKKETDAETEKVAMTAVEAVVDAN